MVLRHEGLFGEHTGPGSDVCDSGAILEVRTDQECRDEEGEGQRPEQEPTEGLELCDGLAVDGRYLDRGGVLRWKQVLGVKRGSTWCREWEGIRRREGPVAAGGFERPIC